MYFVVFFNSEQVKLILKNIRIELIVSFLQKTELLGSIVYTRILEIKNHVKYNYKIFFRK